MIPAREAIGALLLPLLLAGAFLLVPERAGPGPLAPVAGLCALHAALLAPAVARGRAAWGFLPVLLGLPALCAASYGHAGAGPLLGALLLTVLACASGAAARTLPADVTALFYLPSMILLFAAPYALRYLALEFGAPASAAGWASPSPWAAAEALAAGAGLPVLAPLLLLAWPVAVLARRRG